MKLILTFALVLSAYAKNFDKHCRDTYLEEINSQLDLNIYEFINDNVRAFLFDYYLSNGVDISENDIENGHAKFLNQKEAKQYFSVIPTFNSNIFDNHDFEVILKSTNFQTVWNVSGSIQGQKLICSGLKKLKRIAYIYDSSEQLIGVLNFKGMSNRIKGQIEANSLSRP